MGLFNWFKSKGEDGEAAPTQPRVPPPAHARVLKTVSPNTMKPLSIRESASRETSDLGSGFAIDKPLVAVAEPEAPLPPVQPEKDIYLEIGDFVDRIPREYLGNYQQYVKRRIAFRLGDIFADLSKGRATIPLQTLYHFCPEIFSKACTDAEPIPISLPLQKLVEQVGLFENRPDQIMPEQFAPIDTPIARVAAEDGGAPIPITQAGRAISSSPPELPRAVAAGAVSPQPPSPPDSSVTTVAPPSPKPSVIAQTTMAPIPPLPPPPTIQPPTIQPPTIPLPAQSQITLPIPTPLPTAQARPQPARVEPPQPPPTTRPSTQLPLTPAPPAPSQIASTQASRPGPLSGGKRPPATVRASFAGGKITLRASVPAQQSASTPVPPSLFAGQPAPAPRVGIPIPSNITQPTAPAPTPQQEKKITGRIQIPPLRLQGETGGKPTLVSNVGAASNFLSPLGAAIRGTQAPDAASVVSAPPRVLPTAAQPSVSSAPPPLPAQPGQLAFVSASPSPSATPSSDAHAQGAKIHLSLSAILHSLAPHFFANGIPDVAKDVKVALPFDIIEPQLAEGRVVIPARLLLDAAPESIRGQIQLADPEASIPLPLQHLFQNLPENALSLRRDQVTESLTEEYETPFSVKMKEDELRFSQGSGSPQQPPSAAPVETKPISLETSATPKNEKAAESKPPAPATKPASPKEFKPVVSPPTARPQSPTALPKPVAVSTELPVPASDLAAKPIPERAASSTPPPAKRPSLSVEPLKTQKITANELTSETPELPRQVLSRSKGPQPVAVPAPAPAPPVSTTASEAPKAMAPINPKSSVEPPKVLAHPRPVAADLSSVPSKTEKAPESAPTAVERQPTDAPKEAVPRKVAALVPPSAIPKTPVVEPRVTVSKTRDDDDEFDASELQALFMTEEHLDAKNIVKHTSRLPGISGCLLMFADGLPIAGNLPDTFSQDAFGAIIPRFMGKVQDYSRDLRLGTIETVTMHTEKGPVSFFMHDKVCMALLHSKSRFLPGVREKLAVVVREVSQMYAEKPKH